MRLRLKGVLESSESELLECGCRGGRPGEGSGELFNGTVSVLQDEKFCWSHNNVNTFNSIRLYI